MLGHAWRAYHMRPLRTFVAASRITRRLAEHSFSSFWHGQGYTHIATTSPVHATDPPPNGNTSTTPHPSQSPRPCHYRLTPQCRTNTPTAPLTFQTWHNRVSATRHYRWWVCFGGLQPLVVIRVCAGGCVCVCDPAQLRVLLLPVALLDGRAAISAQV